MLRLISAIAATATLTATAANAISLTVYTDPIAFAAAAGSPLIIEDFETAPIASIELADGEIAYLGILGFTYEGELDVNNPDPWPGGDGEPRILPDGEIDGSLEFVGEINANGDPSGIHTFIMPYDVVGFGADFFNALTTAGLKINILGYEINLFDYMSSPGTGFLGILSDTPFSMVYFDTALNRDSEVFRMDNVALVKAPSPIPLPAAAWLLLSGVAAMFAAPRIGRRKPD